MVVVVNSASSDEAGERLAAELPGASYVPADIGDPDHVGSLVARAVEHHGRLDVLVKNAGVTAVIDHHNLDAVHALLTWSDIGWSAALWGSA